MLVTSHVHVRASVITPAYPGRWKKGQNDGNPCPYSEKPTSRRKFQGFLMFYMDFLYFPSFCYIFLGFPINGHPHLDVLLPRDMFRMLVGTRIGGNGSYQPPGAS